MLRNESIPPADYDQYFNLELTILGDGVVLERRRLRVVVPRGRLDAGTPDAGALDAGPLDASAGPADAGPGDAGAPDAGGSDAALDAG